MKGLAQRSLCSVLLCVPAVIARAQEESPDPTTAEMRDEAVASYLADLELLDVLAAHLRDRVEHAQQPARDQAAESLGKLYVKLLSSATTRDERARLEGLAKDLLDRVPGADNPELRVDLAKASYLAAEEVAERFRLRLATDEEVIEALGVLRSAAPVFGSIGSRLHERVGTLERREETASDEDAPLVRAQLADARRLRSLARYYEGWSHYYIGLMTDRPEEAREALVAFGVLLNAPAGKPASVDRMPKGLLRFEHVARSALGSALAASLSGDDVGAIRWLEQLEGSPDLPDTVVDQLFSRRMIVLVRAQRWADAETALRTRRTAPAGGQIQAMSTSEARLVAVLALEALRDGELREAFKRPAAELSQAGLSDLIARGEVGQVVDLVRKFGTLPIGQKGFIVAYVRAIEAFEDVREAHRKGAPNADDPTTDAALVNAYRDAAKLLADAGKTDDAPSFPEQRAQTLLRRGLALYYAGDPAQAADAFEEAFGASPAGLGTSQQDSLWYAVVALDSAIEKGQPSLRDRRNRLATLFLRSFPGSEHATRLLLRGEGGISEDEAIDILMRVPRESPLHPAARRQASRLLYAAFKRAAGSEREIAIYRFADVAEEVIRTDFAEAHSATGAKASEAAQSVIIRARQLADALLSVRVPDLPRVETALNLIDQVASRTGTSTDAFRDEVSFRRLQIALARDDQATITAIAATMQGSSGPFANAADRLLFQRAADVWRGAEDDARLAREVVRHGSRLLEVNKGQGLEFVRDQTAKAAALLWKVEKSEPMRALAVKTDRAQLAAGTRTVASLRRLAQLLEDGGDAAGALEAWNELLGGFDESSSQWGEARYHSLRLLVTLNPAQALQVLEQHTLLHPGGGPPPWGPMIEELRAQLPAKATQPPRSGGGG